MQLKTPKSQDRINITARPSDLAPSLGETALIVVDMQNAYLSKGGYLDLIGTDISGAPRAIASTQAVIVAVREVGLKIIYLQNGFDPELKEAQTPGSPVFHKSNALKFMRSNPQYHGKLITKGSWDFDFVDAIRPKPGDTVVTKARYSGFAGTNLDMILRAHRITTLLLAGVNANVCVESTLRDAYHREYFALMIADATYQSGPPKMLEATIFNVEKFFGWVSTTEEVCRALRAAKASGQSVGR